MTAPLRLRYTDSDPALREALAAESQAVAADWDVVRRGVLERVGKSQLPPRSMPRFAPAVAAACAGFAAGFVCHALWFDDQPPTPSVAPPVESTPTVAVAPNAAAPSTKLPNVRPTRDVESARSDSVPRSTLADELAVYERARSALAGGKGAVALRELRDYLQRFPRGELVPEVRLLMVEALRLAGDAGAVLDHVGTLLHDPALRRHHGALQRVRGEALVEQGQCEGAKRAFEAARTLGEQVPTKILGVCGF